MNRTEQEYGALDILVNNAAGQHPQDDLQKISAERWVRTFHTNERVEEFGGDVPRGHAGQPARVNYT